MAQPGYAAMRKANVNHVFTLIAAYGSLFLFGLINSIKSVSLPMLKDAYCDTYDNQGVLVSISWLGYVIFALFISMLIIRIGVRKVLIIGYGIMIAALASTSVVNCFGLSLASLFIMSIGISFFDLGANALGSVTFTKKPALMMNILHFFYGVGGILGPMLASTITRNVWEDWRAPYLFSLPLVAAMLIFIVASKFTTNQALEHKTIKSSLHEMKEMLKKPLLWLFAVMLGMFGVLGILISNWGGLYLQDVFGMDVKTTGATFVTCFFIALAASRLLSGFIIEKLGYFKSIMWASILMLVIVVLGISLGETGVWIFPLMGVPIGIAAPTTIAIVVRIFPEKAAVTVSLLLVLQCMVFTTLQYVIGLANEYIGAAWGFRTSIIYILVAISLIYFIHRYGRKRGYTFK